MSDKISRIKEKLDNGDYEKDDVIDAVVDSIYQEIIDPADFASCENPKPKIIHPELG